ncbi:homodimeric glycerol 3-phosphate dehydrogenase (quinone) [Robiginitalea myxolifaciens]|uniref:Glycerol-3-phosphate dehydrogenase n=1 Tax=Robiginitalea myxolifaciens TaxID=400055 RepID=A0A1I6G6B3_9FLAO|nr:glycerol-3-phosphate dehydrogenase/oxidase [Robiginitalea myxolifaciens]SFR37587.1 homodimeric glycerol 3-phosphate dehydrogenase (quinone) [Robiginitalea myxolifaciens]
MKKPIAFSGTDRQNQLTNLGAETYDLIVIGGGITGAGIALDASSRGLKTLLLEKGDFASGTSSKSTKLIHGGLRYLKQFDFWLVKEVGSERAIVHKLAPHLVIPEKMLLPLIEGGSYGKWLTSIGLKVYDILAQVEGDDKRRMLEKKEALKKEPLLPKKRLKGAGFYAEYRTDDARLTIELLKTSLQYGVTALNYMRVESFSYDKDGQVNGLSAKDLLSDTVVDCKAKNIINAAGPWVDELRGVDKSRRGKRLHLTKGVHLVFPHEKLPVEQSVYFDVPDGRMIFAIPRGGITYVGTTDTNYDGDKNEVRTDLADAIYLISAVNNMFPDIELGLEDIQSSWAGLRPLIHEEGKSASELSRKDEIFVSHSGLVSIAGGKLTGYRKMAERAVNRVSRRMEDAGGKALQPSKTDQIAICGNDFKNFKAVKKYIDQVAERLEPAGIPPLEARRLVTTYGIQTDSILDAFEGYSDGDASWNLVRAELEFGIAYEQVQNPMDFFIRRTGRLYFNIESMRAHKEAAAKLCGKILGAKKSEVDSWIQEMDRELHHHSAFDLEEFRV